MSNFREYFKLFGMTQPRLKSYLAQRMRSSGRIVEVADGYLYSPGKLPVMLIAHMDTVHKNPATTVCVSADGNILMSPEGIGGDDRCGVIMILELIKKHNCHVLFCEDEEVGSQGASQYVLANKDHFPELNYMVEIDRRGTNDCVFYNCDNEEFVDFVEQFGFKEAYGSFSDISVLAPAMGVAAVNISAGYFDEHRLNERVDLSVVRDNLEKLSKMIGTYGGKFEYIPCKWSGRYGGYYDYDGYFDYGSGYNSSYTSKYYSSKGGWQSSAKEEEETKSSAPLMDKIVTLQQEVAMGNDYMYPYRGALYEMYKEGDETKLRRYKKADSEKIVTNDIGTVFEVNDFGVAIMRPELSVDDDDFWASIDDIYEAKYMEWYTEAMFHDIIHSNS